MREHHPSRLPHGVRAMNPEPRGSQRNLASSGPTRKFSSADGEFSVHHDVSKLSPREREALILRLCEALGVSPDLRPFDLIVSKGKVTLHPRAELAFFLARREGLDFPEFRNEFSGGIYVHHVKVVDPSSGRSLWASGAAYTANLEEDELSNAVMIAETRAYRRAVFRLIGIAFEEPEGILLPEPEKEELKDEDYCFYNDPLACSREDILKFLKTVDQPKVKEALTKRNVHATKELDDEALRDLAKELGHG